jgi:hypothetical protein
MIADYESDFTRSEKKWLNILIYGAAAAWAGTAAFNFVSSPEPTMEPTDWMMAIAAVVMASIPTIAGRIRARMEREFAEANEFIREVEEFLRQRRAANQEPAWHERLSGPDSTMH